MNDRRVIESSPHRACPDGGRKTLVLGLGNPVLTDDAVGIRVARELRKSLADRSGIEVDEDYWGGLRLMERMIGFDRGIVIDAIRTGAEPGTIHRFGTEAMPTRHASSAHDADLVSALRLGRLLGAHLPAPDDVVVVGIEAADVTTFGDRCTDAVEAAIPAAVEAVIELLAGESTTDPCRESVTDARPASWPPGRPGHPHA